MKPEGRALDIAVVGLGQAGGNIASEFFRRGYRALAFNTAQTDLSALGPGGVYPTLPAERRVYVGLDGYDGAGADPAYGRECIREHGERIRAAILKQAGTADVVMLTAGLGGGTGSALGELVKILADDELPLVALATLPTDGESGIAKVNAVRAINEIVDAPLLGWIFVDNARIAALNPDVSIVDYYAHINGQIASPLDSLNRLNDRDGLKAIRSFDGEDFRKLLLSGGVLNYGVVELTAVTPDEVVGTIRECVETSELMPGGFEMSRLSYLGVVIEAGERALATTPISVFEEIENQLKVETHGGAVYNGIYRSGSEQPTMLRLICATQALPERLRQILAEAKREGLALGQKIREELPTLELGEVEGFELFRTSPRNRPSDRPRRSKVPRAADVLDEIASVEGMVDASGFSEQPTEDGIHRKDLLGEEPRVHEPRIVRGRSKATPEAPGVKRNHGAPARTDVNPRRSRDGDAEASGRPPELGTEEIDVVAQLADAKVPAETAKPGISSSDKSRHHRVPAPPAPVPITTPASAPSSVTDVPGPEVYDRLVSDYRHAKHQRAREEVVRRLEEDSISEHTVIRYYAVEAMSKLGRDVFGTALLAATEDENEAVRAIAVEALRR